MANLQSASEIESCGRLDLDRHTAAVGGHAEIGAATTDSLPDHRHLPSRTARISRSPAQRRSRNVARAATHTGGATAPPRSMPSAAALGSHQGPARTDATQRLSPRPSRHASLEGQVATVEQVGLSPKATQRAVPALGRVTVQPVPSCLASVGRTLAGRALSFKQDRQSMGAPAGLLLRTNSGATPEAGLPYLGAHSPPASALRHRRLLVVVSP
jgi:hypothetical protein